MNFSIQFLGATRTVTGSNFLVTAGDTKFLVDCGMYQGPDVEARNLEPFDYNPKDIDFVLLTHTHIDHSGLLPKLVKHGFNGPIYCTLHTAQLVEILLMDSAKIQENNFRDGIGWKHTGTVAMMYSTPDAQKTLQMLDVVNFTEEFEPRPGLKITYVRAGHVLGAASIEVAFDDKLVVFSGDIGREKHILIPSFTPEVKNEADYVVMEALYGGVVHPERGESVNELVRIIQETLADGGGIFIPCFAVQRTQEILYDLKLAKQSGALPNDLPVWLDSPMAQKVTEVYTAALDHAEDSHFNFPGLKYVRNYRTSLKISRRPRQVIIAGSGMADGGRILSHLIANLKNSKNRVIFVGYQAEATIGRAIVDGAHEVMIDKLTVPVKARIHHLHGFSAHGDNDDYVAWLKRYASPKLKKTFLIHADIDRSEALKQNFEQLGLDHPYIPDRRETIQL